jgi:hypothetical protein
MIRVLFLLCGLAWIGAAPAPVFAGAPDWTLEAAKLPTSSDIGTAPAVVLAREHVVEVQTRGTVTRTERLVLRVLRDEGRQWATGFVSYIQDSDRVGVASAWLIRDGRVVRRRDRGEWIDASVDTFGALYSDLRGKRAGFPEEIVKGDVFAMETEVTGPLLSTRLGVGRFAGHT